MIPVIPTNYKLDDTALLKNDSVSKIGKLLSIFDKKMVKTASSAITQDSLITLFSKMLSILNMKVSDGSIEDMVKKLSSQTDITAENNSSLNKQSAQTKNAQERKDEIKIVSKSIKDSHYQIDVSKDLVNHNNQNLYMISCYARDAYLGRYLIKRNFFYTSAREKSADNAYNEIVAKMNDVKERYYSGIIDVSSLFTQMKKTLDGVISEIEMAEDSVATNINR
jgi:hypothetical protein